MFYLDGLSLYKIKEEFKEKLLNKNIGKVSQETELSITLSFGKVSLILSCSNTLPIAYITDEKSLKIDDKYNFVLALKKYISGAEVIKIDQLGLDRILVFTFRKLNELGVYKTYKLYFEIMGKHSNIIITDENNKILDLLKKFNIEDNRLRVLLPNVEYVQPIISVKENPLLISEENFNNFLAEKKSPLLFLEGLGKNISEKINTYSDLQNILNSKLEPAIYLKDNKIILATVLSELIPKEFDEKINFETFSNMVEYYLEKNATSSSIEILLQKITSTLNLKIKKLEKILINIEKDDEEKKNFNDYKEIGDILAANVYAIKKVTETIELFDFYNNKNITINLDPRATIQKNIENFYKKYSKLKRGIESNKTRRVEVQNEIDYLKSTLSFTQTIPTVENLKNIISELETQGYFKNSKFEKEKNKKVKKEKSKSQYGIAVLEENYSIIYGRNNLENDFVTFKVADKEDLWFHIKDIPGSHVILRCRKNFVTPELIQKAAEVAVEFSKANKNDKVNVEYTERKNITKPNGSKPGFVIYVNQKNINIIKK